MCTVPGSLYRQWKHGLISACLTASCFPWMGVSSHSSNFALFGAFLFVTHCLFLQGLPRCFLSCAFLRFWWLNFILFLPPFCTWNVFFYVSIIFLQVFYIHNWHFCAVYVVILLFLKLKKRPRWRLCIVICAIWSWISRPPAWWLRALLRIMVFCNEEIAGTWACQTFELAYTRRTVNRFCGSTLVW